MTKIILAHSGYKKLIVYQGTVSFCRRFLPAHGDRTVDQMTQAARSCKQNIAEGSAAAGASLETQIKLTNVARRTSRRLSRLPQAPRRSRVADGWREEDGRPRIRQGPCRVGGMEAAFRGASGGNGLQPDDLPHSAMPLSARQDAQVAGRGFFKKNGGVRERMHGTRTQARGEAWDKAVYSMLALAKTPEELEARLASVIDSAHRAAWSIKKRNSWNVTTGSTPNTASPSSNRSSSNP